MGVDQPCSSMFEQKREHVAHYKNVWLCAVDGELRMHVGMQHASVVKYGGPP